MKVLLCEDEKKVIEEMSRHIQKYGEERKIQLFLAVCQSGKAALEYAEANNDIDVVFLDIKLGDMLGVEVARILRTNGYRGALIFSTNSRDFYAQGFEVGAIHYLVKPVSFETIEDALKRAEIQLGVRTAGSLNCVIHGKETKISYMDIIYISVLNHRVIVHLHEGEIEIGGTFREVANRIPMPPFLKCHRSFIINMRFVKSVEKCAFIMSNGDEAMMAVRERGQYKEEYLNFKLGNILV